MPELRRGLRLNYITVASSSINGAKINRRRYARSLTELMGVPGATSLLMTTVIQVTAGMGLRSISIVSNAAKGQTRHCVHAHHAMKHTLHSRGLTDTEIAQITPTEALKILLTPDARAVREFVTAIVTQAKAALTASADPGLLQITRLHPDP